MRKRLLLFFILLLLTGGLVLPARAQANVQVVNDEAIIAFPETILFSAQFKSANDITSVILEYGVDQLTCGTVQARAFPAITASKNVQAEWTWEMRQSGSLPPGASVWWQWLVTDSSGAEFTSPRQTITWLDSIHSWETITGKNINLHYYEGGANFGRELHTAAADALVRLSQDIGLTTAKPVDIYIYASTSDLKDAVLYAPGWVGGQAFPDSNIIIIGVPIEQLDWGKSTEAHELTHVLVGHLTFSCLSFIPTWLNEGLAMYGEGGPGATEAALFDEARKNDELLSLRSLMGNFSEESTRANLSYTESHSVVNFMVKTYGRAKMTTLLTSLRDGQTIDEALQAIYGFDTDGLEAAWRDSIGASSLAAGPDATPVPTPTVVPTIVPIGAAPVSTAVISTPHPTEVLPTATPGAAAQAPASTAVPNKSPNNILTGNTALILQIGGACLIIAILLVGVPVFFAIRSRRHGRTK